MAPIDRMKKGCLFEHRNDFRNRCTAGKVTCRIKWKNGERKRVKIL